MKRTKRLLSTLLALCMVLAMLPATAMAAGTTVDPVKTRYTVLVLDCSGSMYGDPIVALREAATKFCEQVFLADTAEVKNQVALVSFDDYAIVESDFTNDLDKLKAAISTLDDRGITNIADALVKADTLLKNVNDANAIKNVLLLTDGVPVLPNSGDQNGPYDDWEANYCYNTEQRLGMKDHYNIYTFGFFHRLRGTELAFCRRFLTDLSTFDRGTGKFYEIGSVKDLDFVFGNVVSDDILDPTVPDAPLDNFDPTNPNRLVVEVRCPVEVTVTPRVTGITAPVLDSRSVLTSDKYGVVTLGEVEEDGTRSKTLVLRPDIKYDIQMVATGKGIVNVTYTEYKNNSIVGTPKTTPEGGVALNQANDILSMWIYGDNQAHINSVATTPYEGERVEERPSRFAYVPTVTGGTVVLSKRNAEAGDWVNVYVTPDEGYKLESLTVTDMRGWPVTLREMGENAFSFTMPNARINVNPVFVKVEADDGPYSTNVPATIPNIEGTSPNYGNMVINTAAMNYSDVNAGDWFYNNVKFCHERYLLNKTGEAEGKFEPNTASTRATVWTALSRLAGRNTVTQGDNWYDRAQIWAKGKGITDGERPMDSMTREEFVTMLWRYDGNKYVQNSALGQFNDGESVSWWATEAVKWAVATGLLNGSNGSLNPQSNVTRAEVAAVLQRYVQNVH